MSIPFRQLLIIQKSFNCSCCLFDERSWCYLSETSQLACNTASFSFVVNVDGIKTLAEEETLPLTLVVLAEIVGDETSDELLPLQYEVLQASLARTLLLSVKEVPIYRVSGVKAGSRKPQAKNRARK